MGLPKPLAILFFAYFPLPNYQKIKLKPEFSFIHSFTCGIELNRFKFSLSRPNMCIIFIHSYECGHIESSSVQLCHLPDCKGEESVYIDEEGHCTLICEEARLEKGENVSITELRRLSMTENMIQEIRQELELEEALEVALEDETDNEH